LQALGGAKVIVITASGGKTIAETFKGLRPGSVSIDLGVGPEPIEVTSMDLIFGERKVAGSLTGNPATADTADFFPPSIIENIKCSLGFQSVPYSSSALIAVAHGRRRLSSRPEVLCLGSRPAQSAGTNES
jgi:D-arabinose 1-dehydrogenase-like Zn-dependent alcohol dehydrogenase